jgi:hypothetical protein
MAVLLTIFGICGTSFGEDKIKVDCKHGTRVMMLGHKGIDLDHDGYIDIQFLNREYGPSIVTEGGAQCPNIGSGNRLSDIQHILANTVDLEYPTSFCDLNQAPIYVSTSYCIGMYFTEEPAYRGALLVLRSFSGEKYYKILITKVTGKKCKFYWSEIDPPIDETCKPGFDGLLEMGITWTGEACD